MRALPLATLCLALAWAATAFAARFEFPLRVPLEAIRQALAAELAAVPGGELYRQGACRYLRFETPKLQGAAGNLRLTGPGTGAFGIEAPGGCRTAMAWQGDLELLLAPRIDESGRLRVRILESRLSDDRGGKAPFFWELGKRHVHPRLERFSYDLGASRDALVGLLRSSVPLAHAGAMQQALQKLEVRQPRVEAAHVVVPLAIEIPDAWLAAAPQPAASAAPLSEAELDALERSLEPWDAFLLTVIRQAALDGEDSALRKRLFTLLIDSRYQLVAILSGDSPAGPDPLRTLFVDAWNELRTIVTDAQRDGVLPASLLRYALFVEAGDALLALEQAAPALALSPEGLRQLARSLRPDAAGDPLALDWGVDAELRQIFGVTEPPEAEAPKPEHKTSWLDLFIRSTYANQELDRWIPTKDELPTYEARIAELLERTSAAELERASLAAPYDKIYRSLVPTTALIESCWRQYQLRGGKVTYLRSQSSSVGIMQINQRVWRGFYDIERVRWDTAYNARAGAQILMRYVKDYAIPYAQRKADPNLVPRAAYAVYNAGPRAVGRFAKAEPHPREQRVDDKLWSLYKGISSGGQADLASCNVRPARTASR